MRNTRGIEGPPEDSAGVQAEPCFPGAVTGETEINCPHCGELLTVTVNEPFGEESYQCSECSSAFDVAWGEGQIKYSVE